MSISKYVNKKIVNMSNSSYHFRPTDGRQSVEPFTPDGIEARGFFSKGLGKVD